VKRRRLFEQAIATTTTRDPTVRLLYVVVSLLLQNVWRYLHYVVWRRPPRRASPLVVAYKEFVNRIRRFRVDGLAVRRVVPANRPPDDRFHR